MLARLTVSLRLTLAFFLSALIAVSLLFMSFLLQRQADETMDDVVTAVNERMHQVSAWQVIATGTTVRIMAINRSNDPALARLFGPDIGPSIGEIEKLFAKIKSWATSGEAQDMLLAVEDAKPRIQAAMEQIEKARNAGDAQAAEVAFEKGFLPAVKRSHEAIDRFAAFQRGELTRRIAQAKAERWKQYEISAALAIVAISAIGILVFRIIRTIKQTLDSTVRMVQAVAEGDISVGTQGKNYSQDEFGALAGAMDSMVNNLRQIVGRVRVSTEHIYGAAREIAQGNQDLSERTERQASHLQQTASTMEELAATVRQSAENAAEASAVAASACDMARRGGHAVEKVVNTMGEIERSSRRVEEIISVIDGISFQTNILALNAAVEAARAGELGRGFAVVASEVRGLAQRSAEAAKEIKILITDSTKTVRDGSSQVQAAGQTIAGLVASVEQVSRLVVDISTTAAEQRTSIDEVSISVVQFDQSTQQNAALVEQAAAAAASMNDQARLLTEAVSVFRLERDMT